MDLLLAICYVVFTDTVTNNLTLLQTVTVEWCCHHYRYVTESSDILPLHYTEDVPALPKACFNRARSSLTRYLRRLHQDLAKPSSSIIRLGEFFFCLAEIYIVSLIIRSSLATWAKLTTWCIRLVSKFITSAVFFFRFFFRRESTDVRRVGKTVALLTEDETEVPMTLCGGSADSVRTI